MATQRDLLLLLPVAYKKFDIKKGDSLFEENNYENIIKRDMAMNITEKLILQLMK